ncbi:MAG: bifunctional riboflavin kinase/FAD synthetase [Firmicutes bacterium]|jgi:riboflavin kinase/FMN adenylyltransferase|nr:bifunctional riboflavin kinase/FAD synthetase [Bacillota bacterium]
MQIIKGIMNFKHYHRGGICLALGNFDGVHVGHRKILRETISMAGKMGKKSAALLFQPHPASVLFPGKAPELILAAGDRVRLLGETGIDYVIIHPFTREFAALSPETFAGKVLVGALQACGVVVGYNYSFGKYGRGTPKDLIRFGKLFHFAVKVIEPVTVDGEAAGSTAIRILLQQGELTRANKMLGYHYFLRGKVVHGDGRGRRLGFPTANLAVAPEVVLPAYGVYLTWVTGRDFSGWGITNVGRRPTFGKKDTTVEIHLIDTEKNIYGKELIVYFLHRLRGEKAFTDAVALVAQIAEDVKMAKMLLTQPPYNSLLLPAYTPACPA